MDSSFPLPVSTCKWPKPERLETRNGKLETILADEARSDFNSRNSKRTSMPSKRCRSSLKVRRAPLGVRAAADRLLRQHVA